MRSSRSLMLFVALVAGGCAENAFLELQLELPPTPAGDEEPWFARIQVRDAANNPFELQWSGGDPFGSVPLGPAARWECISVESRDEEIDVNVRVRFCRTPDCSDLGDPTDRERWFRIERPFYIGKRTFFRARIPRVPRCATDADCDVGVCDEESGRCGCETSADCCPTGVVGCDFVCPAPGPPGSVARSCIREVDRCSVQGCITGDDPMSYCRLEDGSHFCEQSSSVDLPLACTGE